MSKKKEPSFRIMDSDEIVSIIAERMRSKEWWMIAMASEGGRWVGSQVEKRFYRGKANADFELLMIPGSMTKQNNAPIMFSLAFAHKRRMGYGDFLMLVTGSSGNLVGEPDSDVVLTLDAPASVVQWLMEIHDTSRGNKN